MNEPQSFGRNRDHLVAAVFFNDVAARDAIADLKLAHFHADEIAVALPRNAGHDAKGGPSNLEGEHSIRWRLRHSFQHDLHTHGPGLSTREDMAAAAKEKPPFMEIDLADTLTAMGVAKDAIRLLYDRMGQEGLLILVDAGKRGDEAESILERNRGILRTVMVTEPSAHIGQGPAQPSNKG